VWRAPEQAQVPEQAPEQVLVPVQVLVPEQARAQGPRPAHPLPEQAPEQVPERERVSAQAESRQACRLQALPRLRAPSARR